MNCHYCKKEIKKKQRKVLFKEDDEKKVYTELYFHTNCWIEHYNESLDKKVKSYAEKMMKQAIPAVKIAMEQRGMI
jgi:hypothetical protein